MLLPYKNPVKKSITSDNGREFAEQKIISKKLKTAFYFANPYASWERGTQRIHQHTHKAIYSKGLPMATLYYFYEPSEL